MSKPVSGYLILILIILKAIEKFSDVDKNRAGEENPHLIAFTGVGPGLDFKGRMGIVRNTASFGEYYDTNGNIIPRMNCSEDGAAGE